MIRAMDRIDTMVNNRDKGVGWDQERDLLVVYPSRWFHRTSLSCAGKLFDDSRA